MNTAFDSDSSPLGGSLYPVYLRREADLRSGRGQLAVAEFQKILDHRDIIANFVLGALAHLQLGRAKAMSGDKSGARKAYQEFFLSGKMLILIFQFSKKRRLSTRSCNEQFTA